MKAAKHPKRVASPSRAPAPKAATAKETLPPSKSWLKARSALPSLAFFLVYGLCLWKWIHVELIYHGSGQVQDFPSFYWGWDFAKEFRTHPGGMIEYLSALLVQSMYSSFFGAVVLTLQAAAVYVSVGMVLGIFSGREFRFMGLVPALLFLAIYCKYRHYSVAIGAFTFGAVLVCAWARLGPGKNMSRLGLALACAAFLYAAAPSALFVFLPMVLLCELWQGANWISLIIWLGLVSIVPWLEGAVMFGFHAGEAYAKLLPLVWDRIVLKLAGVWFIITLYLLPFLLCVTVAMWRLCHKRPVVGAMNSGLASSPDPSATEATSQTWKWQALALAVLPLVVVFLVLKPQVRALMQVDYFAWNQNWPQVLAATKGNPRNALVACSAAQASFHTGTLTSQLPSLASPADLLLFNDKQQSHWKKSDLYFDLGYLNMALHHLTESVEFYGERPALLRRLALVNLALTNMSTAEVYLGTLSRAPFQSAWARDYLELLKIDPNLDRDEEIGRLRRLMVKRDSVVALAPDEELLMLLAADRHNRMAFEYLMTYYLLTKNLEGFARQIGRVKDFPGFMITPLWDEALVLATRLSGHPIPIPGHVLAAEATTRVETVTRMVQQYKDNPEQARAKLLADYSRTYTFYFWFHE